MANTDFDQKQQKAKTSILSGELAQKITAGDKSAETAFVELNYRWLLFIVRRKFSKSNNHEDIVQDAFMLTIKKLQQGAVKKPEAILGFLRTAAIQIGFDYLRKDKKFTSDIDSDLIDSFKDASDHILTTMIWDDKIHFVKQIIEELKQQRDKDILIKFYFLDEDKKAICEDLDLSSAHFDRVIHRAKGRLKKLVEAKGGYDDSNGSNGQSEKCQFTTVKNHKDTNKNTDDSINNMVPKIYHYVVRNLLKAINLMVRKTA